MTSPTKARGSGKPRQFKSGEPLDIDTIGNALVIKEGDIFLFTDEAGEVRPEARSGFGLYHDDMRYLSEYRLLLQGALTRGRAHFDVSTPSGEPLPGTEEHEPTTLLSTAETGYESEQVLTNRRMHARHGEIIPPQTVQIRRFRVIANGLAERIEITNYGTKAYTIDLVLRFNADFTDIFIVRGLDAPLRGQPEAPELTANAVRYVYHALDGRQHSTEIRFSEVPTEMSAGRARFELQLEPCAAHSLEVRMALNDVEPPEPQQTLDLLHHAYSQWRREPTRVIVDNRFFQQAIDRAFDDIRMLLRPTNGGTLLAAGTPWFDALFGRDSIIASMQMLPYRPTIAADALRLLARYQGREVAPEREEQPGKILHEMRGGEVARTNQVPFGQYYGSIDSTPLFLTLFAEYMAWTDDRALAEELAPNVDAALAWIDEYGDRDGDGYIEYAPSSEGGLVNQGWKDSHDSIIDEHGQLLTPPITLVEAQSYVYAALTGLARAQATLGRQELASRLRERASQLQRQFEHDFWLAQERYLALALDGDNRPSHAITSNAGHALWAGILQQGLGDVVARRLFSSEMFSGWGIRTLSANSSRYNPMGYHLGTIWPHDNALIGMGLKRYGQDDLLVELMGALFDVARASPYYRLPELFCGQPRMMHSPPVPYPVACRPQAWAAGSLPYLLQAMLGLRPDAANQRLVLVRPALPPWLNSVLLEDLRVGEGTTNLLVQRQYDRADVRVIGAKNLTVDIVSEWPAGG